MTGYLIGAGIIVFVWLASIMKAVLWGAGRERDKQARERLEARSEADKIDQAVAGMTDEEVMEKQAKWSRKR